MAITKLTKHNTHRMQVCVCKPNSKHYAALRCIECDVHIQWLSATQTLAIEMRTNTPVTNRFKQVKTNQRIINN